jgi:soluble lytic murein transglycosylase
MIRLQDSIGIRHISIGIGALTVFIITMSLLVYQSLAAINLAEEINQALKEHSQGRSREAIDRLFKVSKVKGRDGLRANLMLGNILVSLNRHDEAVPYLEIASSGNVGEEYARVILSKAIVSGNIRGRYGKANEILDSNLSRGRGILSPVLFEESLYLKARLQILEKRWKEAGSSASTYLSKYSSNDRVHEVRWMRAEAYREAGDLTDAFRAYESIWLDTPKSPWSIQSREKMRFLLRQNVFKPRSLSQESNLRFIKELNEAGMHSEAIEEMDAYSRQFPSSSNLDQIMNLRASSLHSLRKNTECVNTVLNLMRLYPNSSWIPSASVWAIKALRREEKSDQISDFVSNLKAKYPGHAKTWEAVFNQGVFLGNVKSEDEGIAALEKFVAEASRKSEFVPDALWKIAWFHRKQGRTTDAVAAMQKILDDYPSSNFKRAVIYWKARFKSDSNRQEAVELYQSCLREFPHDYYGHMAKDQLIALGESPVQIGNGKSFPPHDPLTDPTKAPAGAEGYVRAVMLKEIGLFEYAASEIETIPGVSDKRDLQYARAILLSRAGNPIKAARILSKDFREFVTSGSKDPNLVPEEFWQTVYPYNYRDEIKAGLRMAKIETTIDPNLVASLIKLESYFMKDAVSPVGAVGLMQIMPGTANKLAKQRGSPPLNKDELFNPETNIRYGIFYLAQLVEMFKGEWFPAICSYNAGEDVVSKWWSQKPIGQPMDEFIEFIPYVDTRLYIKRIIGDYKNYEWIYVAQR